MGELRWTEESVRWLQDIYEYIATDNPQAARNVVHAIYEKARVLQEHPEIGHHYKTPEGREIRILLYGHYRIAYHIKESSDIDILGVFHGALDINRYLV